MRVHVVSDVHGRAGALARAGDGANAVICLGDLLQFLDYGDSRQGIFAELFGASQAAKLIELRTAQRFDQARAFSRQLLAGLPGDPGEHFRAAAAQQYDTLFAALPEPACLTYGNVDLPGMWAARLKPGHRVLDGERAELGGRTFGFAPGTTPRMSSTTTPTRRRSTRSARWTCSAPTSRLPCPSCCTTWWRAGWSGAARRCSR
jgi:hypothetical protein